MSNATKRLMPKIPSKSFFYLAGRFVFCWQIFGVPQMKVCLVGVLALLPRATFSIVWRCCRVERSSHLKKKLYPLAGGRGEPNRLFAKLPRGSVPLEKPLWAGMCRSHRFGCRRTLRPVVSGARCASRGHVFNAVALSGRTP